MNFGIQPAGDEFNGTSVGKQWTWIRENRANHSLSRKKGRLTLTTEPGDVSEADNSARNLLLQSANSDWVIETKLSGSRIPSQPENAGILARQDDDNFVKLMFRAVTKRRRFGRPGDAASQPGTLELLTEENGFSKSAAAVDLKQEITGSNAVILKLEKKGSIYTASYSFDGDKFESLGTADILLKNIKAGLIACDGVLTRDQRNSFWFNPDTTKPETPFDVSFEYFHITASGIED